MSLMLLTAGAALIAACDSSEEMAAEDHTPVRFDMAVNGATMADDTLRLHAGVVDTVRFTYYNAADESLDSEELTHYSSLTFPGGVNATAATDSAAHYSQVVTNTEAAATVGVASVGYGHDAAADEASFTTPFKFE
ncbi:MAG: hypothetical protein OEW17_04620 [Gemmatimonadota bacterium]|nr:hypothetical protein [Gemmatimonadota bacterium]MDH4348067.1 hypothetical protein [Gemmatimonadota bacterium]MDH5283286.1 hypothetical protein [Gemmatimonadota bacterium]